MALNKKKQFTEKKKLQKKEEKVKMEGKKAIWKIATDKQNVLLIFCRTSIYLALVSTDSRNYIKVTSIMIRKILRKQLMTVFFMAIIMMKSLLT